MPDIFVAKEEVEEEVKKVEEEKAEVLEEKKEPVKKVVYHEGGINNALAAFALYPDNVRFNSQGDDEEVVLLLRQHWFTNVTWLLVTIVLLLAPSIIFPVTLRNINFSIPPGFILIFTAIWYLVSFGFAMVNSIVWYFNVYIVTNERVVDVDFFYLLYKQVSSTRINRVQDVTYKLGGEVRSLFNFGDVFVQTAGTEPNLEFLAVPHPEVVVRKISELMEETEEGSV